MVVAYGSNLREINEPLRTPFEDGGTQCVRFQGDGAESHDLLHVPTPWHGCIVEIAGREDLLMTMVEKVEEAIEEKNVLGAWVAPTPHKTQEKQSEAKKEEARVTRRTMVLLPIQHRRLNPPISGCCLFQCDSNRNCDLMGTLTTASGLDNDEYVTSRTSCCSCEYSMSFLLCQTPDVVESGSPLDVGCSLIRNFSRLK